MKQTADFWWEYSEILLIAPGSLQPNVPNQMGKIMEILCFDHTLRH